MRGRPAKPIEVGKLYGLLTPLVEAEKDAYGRCMWRCRCECGGLSTVSATNLRTGEIKSCGCLQRAGNRRTHGHKSSAGASKAYSSWTNMKRRCSDPSVPGWENYGGRGISYDRRWESFENFLRDMGEPPPGTSLDRIDNDGNYTKKNCRWADRKTQRRNSRRVILVTIEGETLVLKDAAEKYSKHSYDTVVQRVLAGWDPLLAILAPLRYRFNKRAKTS